jgi:hypothetical protein
LRGLSHIGVSTLDLDATRAFYELCCQTRPLGEDDATMQVRFRLSLAEQSRITDFRDH